MTPTEKLKKGELESGKEYWVRLTDEWKNSIEQVYFNGEDFERFDIDDIEEVLAPVPSYEEWKTVFNCANKYEVEYIECANDYENVKKENQQLKELLDSSLDTNKALAHRLNMCKELLISAKDIIEWYKADCGYKDTPTEAILTKITNAIGEKK